MAPTNQSSISGLPSTLPNPVTMHEGLVVKGNVFVNWHLDPKWAMSIGLDPCYGTSLPCDKPTVSLPGFPAFISRPHCFCVQAAVIALSQTPLVYWPPALHNVPCPLPILSFASLCH